MTRGYSIDDIKVEIEKGKGFARSNLFRVIFPIIPSININIDGLSITHPQNMNVLCKTCTLPGRLLSTTERPIGVLTQKNVYGFVDEDVVFTFLELNNWGIRKYFESWQNYILDEDTHEVRYKKQYARQITLQSLNLDHEVINSYVLEDAYPVHLQTIAMSNDNINPIEVGVSVTYTKWRRGNVIKDVISTGIQNVLEDVLL